MKAASPELKVGLFVIIVLIVLSFMTFKVGGLDWFTREGYVLHVTFSDITGLNKKTKVKIAGVDAGVIEDIKLEGSVAKISLRMFPDVVIYSDTEASIKSAGLLGDKYLAIQPGSRVPRLQDGDTITNVREVLSIDDVVRKLATISDSINELTSGLNDIIGTEETRESLRTSIKNLKTVTESLNTFITGNDTRLRESLDNINQLAMSLQNVVDENAEPLKTTLANMKDFSTTLKEDTPVLVQNIKESTESLKEITTKIEKGEGTLGKLVQDDTLYTSVSEAAEGINKTISAVDRFRFFLTFQGDYLTDSGDAKGYFYVTLQPKPDKYYILGVVSDPVARLTTDKVTTATVNGVTTTIEEEEFERRIEFTALYVRRFEDTALKFGIIENSFGLGVDHFLLDDKLKLTADIWDFAGDEEDADSAHAKVGLEYYFYKKMFLSAGYDNPFNSDRDGAYVGGGLRFEDDDFKYLFTRLPRISTN